MALTALICALTIGSPVALDRNDLIIEARAYNVLDKNFKLEGPTLHVAKPPKDYPGLKISSVIGFDAEKLRNRADMAVKSKPVLRVVAGKSAQWILNQLTLEEKPETSKFTLTPIWREDKGIDLAISLSLDRTVDPKEKWTYSETPALKTDQYFALLVSSQQRRVLYTFRVQPR